MILSSQRDQFSIPRDICYLNAAYMTPQSKRVQAAGRAALDRLAAPWTIGAGDFFEPVDTFRAAAARMIGATADDIAVVPATSYGIAVAAANLPVARGEAIVVLDDQFPSNVYSWRRMVDERDAELVTVPEPADHDWTAAVLETIDRIGDRLAIVAVPNVHWATGARLDLVAVRAASRRVGAALVLDLTQSLGAMPFSVADVEPDFAAASTYKWLFGAYGISFVYVAPQHQCGRPIEENWANREGSHNFAGLSDYQDGYLPGARRFDMGERSNFALLPVAEEGLRQLLDWGVDNVAQTLSALNETLVKHFSDHGFEPIGADRRGPHLAGVRIPDTLADIAPGDLADRFRRAGVLVSVRGRSIRLAPHVYVDAQDIDRVRAILTEF